MQQSEAAAEYPQAMIMIEQAVPCILHCENRCGEKLLKMLLIEGYDRRDPDSHAQEEMVAEFEEHVNTRIFGSENARSNWRINHSRDKDFRKVVGKQTLTNMHTRKLIDNFEHLPRICIQNDIA